MALLGRRLQAQSFTDPGPVRFLLSDPRSALLWTPLRLYLGWQWLSAGLEKVNSTAWTRSGAALQGFLTAATKGVPGQKGAAIHYGWYHDFLTYMLNHQWYTWFGRVVAFGETAVGIALIIGAFAGIAAFFGAAMNFNYLLAGTSSTNPILFALAVLLLLAWKVAGYIGLDSYLLPALGTPWQAGQAVDLARRRTTSRTQTARVLAEGLLIILMFAAVGVLTVLANNAWRTDAPWLGYLVSLAAVVAGWVGLDLLLSLLRGRNQATTVRDRD